jgi:hypothetical protein
MMGNFFGRNLAGHPTNVLSLAPHIGICAEIKGGRGSPEPVIAGTPGLPETTDSRDFPVPANLRRQDRHVPHMGLFHPFEKGLLYNTNA